MARYFATLFFVFFLFYLIYEIDFYSIFYLDVIVSYIPSFKIEIDANEPLFFYFGLLFFLTTFLGFFFLSYLGLYGVFFINFLSISLFWASCLLYF
jgi:hypothetical protein